MDSQQCSLGKMIRLAQWSTNHTSGIGSMYTTRAGEFPLLQHCEGTKHDATHDRLDFCDLS